MTIAELPNRADAEAGRAAARWQPTRAGILNVWRYYDEVFEFHNGRLLLRGPNGSGKSKVLELLLPYLFDASLRPNRLSTFGTSERTMHWNLMGEGASGTTRVGYVWLEFARMPGLDEYVTCGARLQATTRTTDVTADYFTTSLRVGTDLSLTNASGQPLTKAVLTEQLDGHGTVHPNRAEYRATVRQLLFPGLSEQRYEALITALLQLRTPKLSQRLDPGLLSSLLSRALPPLDQEDIAELAEGFERLDQQGERLKELDEEVEAARKVATRQRSYAQRVLRAASADLITATKRMTESAQATRQSETEHQEAVAARTATEQQRKKLAAAIRRADASIEGLTKHDLYEKGSELDDLRRRTGDAQRAAREQAAVAERKSTAAATDRKAAEDAAHAAEQWVEQIRVAAEECAGAARRAGLDSTYGELIYALEQPNDHSRQLLRAAVQGRQQAIELVRRALEAHDRAVDARTEAEHRLEDARTELSQANDRRDALADQYDEVLREHEQALLAWASACEELVFDDPAAFVEIADSEAAVLARVAEAAERRQHDITVEETTLSARWEQAETTRTDLVESLEKLRGKVDLPPHAPPHRTADRTRMAGAPLWRLVTFADHVTPAVQVAVEAALQAAGLLDAWVNPSGALVVDGHDTFLDGALLEPAPGRSLREVLVAEPDSPVPVERVEELLAAIAFGDTLPAEHPAACGADGRWRLGAATGSWAKNEVEHIGAVAREQSRLRRIAELTEQLDDVDRELDDLSAWADRLAQRRRTLAVERERRPSHTRVKQTWTELDRAENAVSAADSSVRAESGRLHEREESVRRAQHALHLAGTEHGIPTAREALDKLGHAVEAFRERAQIWFEQHTNLATARSRAELLQDTAGRSAADAAEFQATAERIAEDAQALDEELRTLERLVDADDLRQIVEELEQQRRLRRQLLDQDRQAGKQLNELHERIGRLGERLAQDSERRNEAVLARDNAADRFRKLTTSTLVKDAALEVELTSSGGVTAVLEAARTVASKWPTLPHEPKHINDALHRLNETVYACRDVLSGRADLELATDDEIRVFTAVLDGTRVGAHQLLETLRAEAERSRDDLTESERELFDRTLTGDTRRQLADRIRQAGELVDAMNTRLERVRTASRVAVRLVWQVDQDLPAGTKDARQLLLKDPVWLSEADRESLHRFFRERIEAARADNTSSNWREQLAQVFDYTAWHRFVVKLDRADGKGWQPLTKKLHGALSGGEKAIALHLPLFAAVAAHYQGVPSAPRLILLDEVFVGVDSSNRGQVFELLASLDLDLVLTSDHEWCAYRELPGIAIHQLVTGDDDDAVTTARFVWTGKDWAGEQN
ncbi:TIGR02680 family protein [Saccharomonospora xinjiangensis]|uniref:TIGR02680 family protein n=1 Tax=Saccharomonospora xinjiangensis XJ-54 TaxID=882086 RepID=I0UWT3_9PSEU|nr:TIGR02680 family protein [Saccharomonospora xinjiangensis]EID52336.1 TIGR02680 family protein [Saccharomonospora xinjiangensis XJ-54]